MELRYVDCSPVIINHLPSIFVAGAGGTVLSVTGPFRCESCQYDFEISINTPNITAIKPQISGTQCPKCGAIAKFDEIPQEYFQFLM